MIGVNEGRSVDAIAALPTYRKRGIGFLDVDRFVLPVSSQPCREPIGGVELTAVAVIRTLLPLTCPRKLGHEEVESEPEVNLPQAWTTGGWTTAASSGGRLAGIASGPMKHRRHLVADRTVRAHLVMSLRQASHFSRASSRLRNQCAFRHSARNLPFRLSMNALSVGLPGRLKSSVTPRMKAHKSSSLLMNSGPLSS